MTIYEKLDRLTRLSNRSKVSREAGMSSTYISTILCRKSQLTIAAAAELARVLGVDCGWLVDDAREWPPVRARAEEPAGTSVA